LEFPLLFKKTKTGATQQWQVFAEDHGFYTVEGLVGGKLTTSTPYICEGKNPGKKNATTAKEQAIKQAQSAWQKKLDHGYSQDILTCGVKKYFEPMLAEKYADHGHKLIYPVFSQPKLDGVRCITKLDGMWSRNGKPFLSAMHIHRVLKKYLEMGIIFDGELYCDKYKSDFNKIISYVRKTKNLEPAILEEIENELEYWIYDFASHPGNFGDRYESLQGLFADGLPKGIVLVETAIINNSRELDAMYEVYQADGVEGQIIRMNTPYENFRTKNLLKRKEFFDAEYTVIGVIEGMGNRTGTVGKLVFDLNGKDTFEANVKGNFTYLRKLLAEQKELIGKQATVRYPNLTPDGKPRFGYVVDIRDYE
jgi:ATP-dependent DNA ligase